MIACSWDGNDCHRASPVVDCSALGAHCAVGQCVFDEACPADVDALCRDNYVLTCAGGRIERFAECVGSPCVDVVLANGHKAAACNLDPTDSCATQDPAGAECHAGGSVRVGCSYGVVTLREPCTGGACVSDASGARCRY